MASSLPAPSFGCCSFALSNSTSATYASLSFPRISLSGFPGIPLSKNGSGPKIRAKFAKFQGEFSQEDIEEGNSSSSLQEQPSASQEDEEDDSCLPSDLEGAVRQSGEAAGLFVSSGGLRAIVELLIPQLQFLDDEGAQAELWELSRIFLDSLIEETKCQRIKAVFPDAGAAALLEYRWKDTSFKISRLWKVFYDDKDRPDRYLLAKELISRPDAGDLEIIFGNVAESEQDPSFFDKAAGVLSSVTRFMKAISK